MKAKSNCPVCSQSNSSFKNVNFNVNSPISNQNSLVFSLEKCSKCLLFYNKAFDKKNIDYSNISMETFFNHSEAKSEMNKICLRIFNFLKKENISFSEFGCGDGEFLKLFEKNYKKFFKKNLKKICGFDIGNSLPKENIFTRSKEQFLSSLKHKYTKFIAVRHVLEHLETVDTFFSDLKNINNTYLYIEVPNGYESVINSRFEDLHYEHVSYMSFQSLLRMCYLNDFKVLDIFESLNGENISVLAHKGDQSSNSLDKNIEKKYFNFYGKFKRIRSYLDNEKKVFWGVGGRCKSILERLSNLDEKNKIKCNLVDSDRKKLGIKFDGYINKVVLPEKIDWKNIDEIIIGTRVGLNSIKKELKSLQINLPLKLWDEI